MEYEEMDNSEVEMPEEFVEEPEDSDAVEEEYLDEPEEEKEQPTQKANDSEEREEPGYVQTRIQKALARERESMRAEIMAQVEAQYAPIRDRLLEMDAQELVRTGEFKSIERAKEYLQLKQGVSTESVEQPRDEQGRYTSVQDAIASAKVDARIAELKSQAEKIKADSGLDVIAEYNRNEEVKEAIINGEMDFYDVAKQMKSRKRPPSPSRSPNGVNGIGPQSISSMSDAQFRKMDKMLDQGVRFTIRR
jgi:hypothetical protein